jgi:hypothetical protein
VILDWISARLSKIAQRARNLQAQETGTPELGTPPASAELKDLGLIRAWLKSQESEIFDELEGLN